MNYNNEKCLQDYVDSFFEFPDEEETSNPLFTKEQLEILDSYQEEDILPY